MSRPQVVVVTGGTSGVGRARASDTGVRRIDVGATTTAVAWADAWFAGSFEHLLARVGLDLQQEGWCPSRASGSSTGPGAWWPPR